MSDMHTASTLLLLVRHEEMPASTSDTQGTLPAIVSDIKEGTPKNGGARGGPAVAYIVYDMNMPGHRKTMSDSQSGIAVNASDMHTAARETTVLPAMPPCDTTTVGPQE
jgi:hypothetical protein